MKNKLIGLTSTLVLALGMVTSASAGLIDRGNGMIYDDDLDITWLADANYAQTSGYDADGRMSWEAATSWAENLSFGGFDDWRLFNADPGDTNCSSSFTPFDYATQNYGDNCTGNELGHLFYGELGLTAGQSILSGSDSDSGLFTNLEPRNYWSDTEFVVYTGLAWAFSTGNGSQFATVKNNELFAWAVRSGDVVVSEPGTLLLLAAGLVGVAGAKRRRC